MNDVSDKKSRMLYQRGDKAARGVVDLRCFSDVRRIVNDGTRKSLTASGDGKTLDLRQAAASRPRSSDNDIVSEIRTARAGIDAIPDIRYRKHLPTNTSFKTEPTMKSEDSENPESFPITSDSYREIVFPKGWSRPRQPESVPAAAIKKTAPKKKRLASLSIPVPMFSALTPEITGAYHRRSFARFAIASFLIPAVIFSFSFIQGQFDQTGKVLGASTEGYNNLKSAAKSAYASDFSLTDNNFDAAGMNFNEARETINNIGLGVGEVVGMLPIETPVSTAQELTTAGENISLAGKDLSGILEKIASGISSSADGELSFESLTGLEADLAKASMHLSGANKNFEKVEVKYIPENMQSKIELAKTTLPGIARNFERFSADYPSFIKMLGSEKEQKYLLLFENNSEMRATGGFIGTYGILDIDNGKVKELMIDGIFNPDGQLKDTIVPPMAIQKISANWSMHDSNWFADFPTSAQKTALFYEKTGGPTVDGVIAITPQVMEKLLTITGPIEMPEYGVTLTSENFVATTQDQVENLYDKEENNPKRILSDLAPLVIEKLFKDPTLDTTGKAMRLVAIVQKIEESLAEKDILIYHRDDSIETMLKKRGWGGELAESGTSDYLAVINSNINGYKTDAVIEESIDLKTEITDDGSIIDTVTITRKHNGGNEAYDWYNRVNADYMRVYVPQGSVLLEASGQTPETYAPPVDYKNYQTDADVAAIESTIRIDPASQTQIFEESGKTVFGNWVYVSPQEEVTVIYRYQLPFKIDFGAGTKSADVYSAIIQKQAGSLGSSFTAALKVPDAWQTVWQTDNLTDGKSVATELSRDLIYAGIFTIKD